MRIQNDEERSVTAGGSGNGRNAAATADPIAGLFGLSSHNPSFLTVKNSIVHRGDLLDFCVPVNLRFPPPVLTRMIVENLEEILRYYPDYADVHQTHIALLTDLAPETIVAANGATEIISILCQEAAGPMVTCVPTFGRWTDIPMTFNVPLHTIERRREDAFRLEVGQIIRKAREVGAETLVLSNPNNPTGASLSLGEIEALVAELRDLRSIIIDESFIDFSDLESAAPLAARTHNLVVVKSMGKSIGWHGVRLGYAVAEPERAQSLRVRMPFWNVNGIAAFVLRHLPRFKAEYRASFVGVSQDRAYLSRCLAAVPGLTVYPSQANFVFVELPEGVSGRMLRDRLLANHGVMVRENSNKIGSTEQYLRVAVQRKTAVDVLVSAIGLELAHMIDCHAAPPT